MKFGHVIELKIKNGRFGNSEVLYTNLLKAYEYYASECFEAGKTKYGYSKVAADIKNVAFIHTLGVGERPLILTIAKRNVF